MASQRTLVYGQVVLATDNLYSQCRAHSVVPHAATASPLQQLDVIGHYLSDLVAACQQQAAVQREQQAAAAAGGQPVAGHPQQEQQQQQATQQQAAQQLTAG